MSFLRGSTNFVWCTTSVLGKGATGAVFQGVNKNTGEPVAVKTFNQLSHMRPHDVQLREFEVLKKVKHENIVKLLAIDEEQEGRGKVIVMELCTGGSLFNILDDPENTYGVKEDEFLLVLDHLTAGMKHLRDNNLVHRDLKPGNIMKFVNDDGTTVYKLTDFGAARHLEEDEQFVSLYGTEEYLHPDMYERAVLRKAVRKTFGATVDLWSIGVTLYHVATGNLPFRPYGGRRNKETMYFITTKKESGVISGTQSIENGPINWCRTLPKSCQLSEGLKKHVTPLLAGLLEVDGKKIWSFEKFFSEVTNALSRKKIHVYNIHKMENIKIYFHPEGKYADFQTEVTEQTEILSHNQVYLYDKKHLFSITKDLSGKDFPDTTENDPVLLFSNENRNVVVPNETENLKMPMFPNATNVENDATTAKTMCSVAHLVQRKIDRYCLCSKLTHDSVEMFNLVLQNELSQVLEKATHLVEIAKHVEMITDAVTRGKKTVNTILNVKNDPQSINWKTELQTVTEKLLLDLDVPTKLLFTRYVTENMLVKEWERNTSGCKCCWKTKAPERANSIVKRLRDSWQHMVRDRATKSLTYNDEQFHVLERMKMDVMGNDLIKNLFEKEVCQCIAQIADSLADWYKMAQTIYLQAKILNKDVDTHRQRLDKFLQKMIDSDIAFHGEIATLERLQPVSKHNGRIKGADSRVFRASICEIRNTQEEIDSIIKANQEIIQKFSSIPQKKEKS